MKGSTRVIDRILAGLVGLVLLGGGLWALGDRLGQRTAADAADRVSVPTIVHLPDQPWWPAVTGAAGAVLVLVALWLLVRHLRSSASRTAHTPGDGTVDLGRVADAVAADLGRSPLIRRARPSTVIEKGRPVIRVAVAISPGAPVDELTALAAAARHDVVAATGPDVAFQVLVNDRRGDRRLGEHPRDEDRTTIERT
ncbi:alkaline shock response membrane anchor protein AmaP [Tsukamurella tyrosinosolvens]|uniref:hypothetical protein n=1 Tax=Tsukamurella tyrosinosolvens TaxID=57704 RepID=UPI000799DA13|nr:hypothetical protein [Tsukamurella tyrosinosolvens]KXP01768.1 hypothetical protein AXK59_22210 [Tsukamurella tyrosinosolvens]KZL94958.1 hypothetical protein AXX05_10050 [Tsukamurella tyrosinosolvens]MCA4997758.1 alkaline shock response membrane anchor protein AmaP [Tsukamurella tyrosinosolvens]WEL93137.1 alkaline shock response membrane anchor protein AmaP [Tsukamurella tyrosinosolvens]